MGSSQLSISQNSDSGAKEAKPIACVPGTPQRVGPSTAAKPTASNLGPASSTPNMKRNSSKSHSTANVSSFSRADVVPVIVPRTSSRTELASDSRRESGDVVPVIVPRTNPRVEQSSDFRKEMGDVGAVTIAGTSSRVESTLDSRKESVVGRTLPFSLRSKFADRRKLAKINDDSDKDDMGNKVTESNEAINRPYVSVGNNVNQIMTVGEDQPDDIKQVASGRFSSSLPMEPSQTYHHEKYNIRVHKPSDASSVEVSKGGRTRSLVANWESRDQSPNYEGPTTSTSSVNITVVSLPYSSRHGAPAEKEDRSASDEDGVAGLIEQHELFLGSARSRLTKLQEEDAAFRPIAAAILDETIRGVKRSEEIHATKVSEHPQSFSSDHAINSVEHDRNKQGSGAFLGNYSNRAEHESSCTSRIINRCSKRYIALKVTYFGQRFYGFASEAQMEPTVESEIFKALERTKLLVGNKEESRYSRCGRTDKGVSSTGQVISLYLRSNLKDIGGNAECKNSLSEEKCEIDYVRVLNRVLPKDIRVIGWCPVPADFHARFSCLSREYRYFFWKGNLDIPKMQEAAAKFIGEHDFRNFCKMDAANVE